MVILVARRKQRAERYHFPQHKRRYIAAKGNLRRLLARYLKIPAEQILFYFNAHGKPLLSPEEEHQSIHFNSSDSHELAIYAFTLSAPIGIDLEWMKKSIEAQSLAERFFSNTESQALALIEMENKEQAFYKLWTRKEAFIKAIGEGLSFPLKEFEVSLDDPATLLTIHGSSQLAADWFLFGFQPEDEYMAAVACQQKGLGLTFYSIDED